MIRLLVLTLAVLLGLPTAAAAADLPAAGAFLARSLDGEGCAREAGGRASVSLTAWVTLGLVATGRDSSRAAGCIVAHAQELRVITDVELAILALVAAGRPPVRGGVLPIALDRAVRGGRIGPTIASTQFGVLALRALGRPVPAAVRAQVERDQSSDGSWSVGAGGDGDSNLTASGIEALIAAGVRPSSRAVGRGVRALELFRAGGGFALGLAGEPDAQSTAWALQGLAAVGQTDDRAVAYLTRLQGRDGAFSYSAGQRITPVWVTAQAVLGLARRPFPLRP